MRYFKLPDLGEGLPEAEILEWHVNEGDQVKVDQILLSVETAKAIIEVPSPQDGTIEHLFGAPGDTIHTGEPLLEFAGEKELDSGTVVGELKQQTTAVSAAGEQFFIGASPSSRQYRDRHISPAARALAQRLDIDVNTVPHRDGRVTAQEVEAAADRVQRLGPFEPLRGVRKQMARTLASAWEQVVAVTIHDDADIEHWPAGTDITLKLIDALAYACQHEPSLNAWFDGERLAIRQHPQLDLGVAVDTEQGLFVPVLRNVSGRSSEDLRAGLNRLREDVRRRSIPPSEMLGATLTLSNFGMFGGRYATPTVVPPQVAILGAGKIVTEAVVSEGVIEPRRRLPLSLTFDHRAATGAEAAHFMQLVVTRLQDSSVSSPAT
ncbi:dihydrolipoamide acetyltransferase component of pyruvate dehydrogenase complex [Marinobacterium zhoushanense]|uniref:Dihydrolipoamide acetyltransferase component of pyruvate dehydrogenase complex n=1 Tax=Marinobacterium zhoushanense TaxID=1679163 RepID=A0ABQ1K9P9_9GAMM|nr:dihydrolipoamide acetyltransferase family protein [Marinobacterium zhoushanense]GGB88923.1 dihydrolipoamide acetyltransferase component of pyruvate dehydrogenase complex [Marinobacterium zhoushanense]